ncbi:hypothetical protein [Colwellia sp. RSH04]|uniref:hypothetical protein n=1 Tax=Colwellia sp. RSH04 TaxID=2305464 RepID=UPI000E572753|nr:hypothetical protein [Colwellia sp. RSH04]RHW76806.1 hypothetical protein D1094_06900 [Colwellia sp. RSH04]
MLIIEIALGIVLAVIIINYWRDIINFGVVAIIGLVILSVLFGIGYFIYDGWDSIAPFLPLLFTIICFVIGMPLLFKVSEFIENGLSKYTIKAWNLTGGECIAILLITIMLSVGLSFLFRAVIMKNPPHNELPIGLWLVFFGGLIYKKNMKTINKTRGQRIIKSTYEK